jgi:hypothetical protein
MVFPDERQSFPVRFLALTFCLAALLTGCAGSSSTITKPAPLVLGPEPAQIVVDGQATDQQRAAINASNQRIFDAEHAATPAENAAPPTPANPQGGIPQ